MGRDYSPEEKLLRLIKKTGLKNEQKYNLNKSEGQGNAEPMKNDPGNPQNALSNIFRFGLMDLKRINILLVFALLLSTAYFLFNLYDSVITGKKEAIFPNLEKVDTKREIKDDSTKKQYSYYSSELKSRNIFSPQEPEEGQSASNILLDEVASNLSLIGIIAGDKPQAIIEDKKLGKSFFLYKGGSVGQAKIIEILENSVTMEFRGNKFELLL